MSAPRERCSRCRFWRIEPDVTHTPHEEDAYGRCRFNPPTLVSSMVAPQLPPLAYGQQEDIDLDAMGAASSSVFPVTSSTEWCGRYVPYFAGVEQEQWPVTPVPEGEGYPGTYTASWEGVLKTEDTADEWERAEQDLARIEAAMEAMPLGTPDHVMLQMSDWQATVQRQIIGLRPTNAAQALRRLELAVRDGPLTGVDVDGLLDEAKAFLS